MKTQIAIFALALAIFTWILSALGQASAQIKVELARDMATTAARLDVEGMERAERAKARREASDQLASVNSAIDKLDSGRKRWDN